MKGDWQVLRTLHGWTPERLSERLHVLVLRGYCLSCPHSTLRRESLERDWSLFVGAAQSTAFTNMNRGRSPAEEKLAEELEESQTISCLASREREAMLPSLLRRCVGVVVNVRKYQLVFEVVNSETDLFIASQLEPIVSFQNFLLGRFQGRWSKVEAQKLNVEQVHCTSKPERFDYAMVAGRVHELFMGARPVDRDRIEMYIFRSEGRAARPQFQTSLSEAGQELLLRLLSTGPQQDSGSIARIGAPHMGQFDKCLQLLLQMEAWLRVAPRNDGMTAAEFARTKMHVAVAELPEALDALLVSQVSAAIECLEDDASANPLELFQQTWHGLYADYINVADEVLLPRIRTAEPWETASEIGCLAYRWRSRFCSNAGIVELTDLDGTSADDTTVGRLKGLALKGAEAHEVPLISVASAVVEHWELPFGQQSESYFVGHGPLGRSPDRPLPPSRCWNHNRSPQWFAAYAVVRLFYRPECWTQAADHNLSFRLPVSISWFRYSEDGGIFSELPSSFWYTSLNDMDQIVGSPSHMRYAEPQVRSDARKVVVHGYFQEILPLAEQIFSFLFTGCERANERTLTSWDLCRVSAHACTSMCDTR
eukprot:g27780.t1